MKLVTFEPAAGCERLGVWVAGKIVDLALASDAYQGMTQGKIPSLPSDMMAFLNLGESAIQTANGVAIWAQSVLEKTGKISVPSGQAISYDPASVRLRAPVPRPPKILCLALNYVAHAEERSRPLPQKPYVFLKPGISPVVGTNDPVIGPPASQQLAFEGELAVVIGKRCRFVPRDKAYEVVAGYTAVNDMSARDLGKTNVATLFDWFQVKAFDTSLPMGPYLVMKDEITDPHNLKLSVRVNGKIVQETFTGEMLFKIPETIEFISDFITLEPGDIIATGTPGGSNAPLKIGDQVEVEITNLGVLRSIIAGTKS
jgi:acylpyruvate hydrolase